MISMKKKFAFHSAKRKLLVSFLVVLIIPVAIGTVGYIKLRSNIVEQAERSYASKLDEIVSDTDDIHDKLVSIADIIAKTQWVGNIAYTTGEQVDYQRTTYYDLGIYAAQLQNYQTLISQIDRIMIAFPEKNMIMSMNGIQSYNTFFSHYFNSSMALSDWTDLLGHYYGDLMINPMDVVNYGKSESLLTYITPVKLAFYDQSPRGAPYVQTTPKATLMISLKEADISKYLQEVFPETGVSVCVMNANGIITQKSSNEIDFSEVSKQLDVLGETSTTLHIGNADYMTIRLNSQKSGWNFLVAIPQSLVMQDVNETMTWTILIFLISILVSLLVAYVLFQNNYKPLNSLVERMNSIIPGTGKPGKPGNEYSLIDQAFQSIVENENSLQDKLEYYYPMAVHSFFSRLLYETNSGADFQPMQKSLGIGKRHEAWVVAVLYSEGGSDIGRTKAARWITEDMPVYIIEVDANRYAIIINSDDEESVDQVLDNVRHSFAGSEGQRFILGIGNPCEGLEEIGRSYREALLAVNHAFYQDDFSADVVHFNSLPKPTGQVFIIPQTVEDDLKTLLRSGEQETLNGYLISFIDQNIRKVGTGHANMQAFFYNLLTIALKSAPGAEIPKSFLIDEQRLMTMNTADDMKQYISDVYRIICESMRSDKRGHLQKMRSDIIKFIDENCLNETMSLQSVADIFGVSVPYLSKFIKDQTGSNFLDYLAKKRIAHAKELLHSRNLSLQQVGEQIGYANALTFRRVFKKIEGINPADYRARVCGSDNSEQMASL